jgi:preprotein translocase subunit SecF
MFNFIFQLVENRRRYFIFSGIVISLGILAMLYSLITTGAVFPLGVDFRSGTRFEVQFTATVTENGIRDVFNQFGVNNPSVIALRGEGLANAWQIRTEFVTAETAQAISSALDSQLAPLVPDTTLVQSVSPSVGAEVTRAAFVAVIVAAIVILFYIMLAFRQVPNPLRYGACAVAAMVHDSVCDFWLRGDYRRAAGLGSGCAILNGRAHRRRLLAARYHRRLRPHSREHCPPSGRKI